MVAEDRDPKLKGYKAFRFGHDGLKRLDDAQALLGRFLADMFRRFEVSPQRLGVGDRASATDKTRAPPVAARDLGNRPAAPRAYTHGGHGCFLPGGTPGTGQDLSATGALGVTGPETRQQPPRFGRSRPTAACATVDLDSSPQLTATDAALVVQGKTPRFLRGNAGARPAQRSLTRPFPTTGKGPRHIPRVPWRTSARLSPTNNPQQRP